MAYRLVYMRLLMVILFLCASCSNKEKKYEDYEESDFYEVQGVITEIVVSPGMFDSPRNRNIYYDYFLDLENPQEGKENNIDLVLNPGDPIVVLVHKDNDKISFFGRYGIIDERMEMH